MPKPYVFKLEGLETVKSILNYKINQIKGKTKGGLMHAALIIRRRSQQLTPVHTGNLKGSAYTQAWALPGGLGPGAEIGYTASYAVFVHEIEATHKGQGTWKFLEYAMQEKAGEVLKIIRDNARIR